MPLKVKGAFEMSHEESMLDQDFETADDFDTQETIVENMKALVEKERMLSNLQVLEKEKELLQLKEKYERLLREKKGTTQDNTEEETTRGDDLVKKLARMPVLTNVKVLNLTNCGMNEQDTRTVALQLRFLPKVQTLILASNDLSDSCSPALELLVTEKTNLEHLDLRSNNLGLRSILSIVRAITSTRRKQKQAKLRILNVTDNPFSFDPDAGKQLSAEFPYSGLAEILITVHETNRQNQTQRRSNPISFIQGISKWKSLTSFGLMYSVLSPQVMEKLCSSPIFSRLETLDLRFSFIGFDGVSILARWLVKNRQALSLWQLNLTGNSLSFAGCETLMRALPRLNSLTNVNMSNNLLGGYHSEATLGAICTALRESTWIQSLDISQNDFTPATRSKGLASLHSLTRLHSSLQDLGPLRYLRFAEEDLAMFRKHLKAYKASHSSQRGMQHIQAEGYTLHRIQSPRFERIVNKTQDVSRNNFIIRLSRAMVGENAFSFAEQGFKIFLRIKLVGSSIRSQAHFHHMRRASPVCQTKIVEIQADESHSLAHLVVEHCKFNDELILSVEDTRKVVEFALVFLPNKSSTEHCHDITRGPKQVSSEHWDKISPLTRMNKRGVLRYLITIENDHLNRKTKHSQEQTIQLIWEDRVEFKDGQPVRFGAGQLPRSASWKIFRNDEYIPLLTSGEEVQPIELESLSPGGFVKHTVQLRPDWFIIGDKISLELRYATSDDDDGACLNVNSFSSTNVNENTFDDTQLLQIHSRNFAVQLVHTTQ